MASGTVVYGSGFLSLVASYAESVARLPVEVNMGGSAVMAVGAGEFITMKPVIKDHVAIVCFVGECRCTGSPSKEQKQQDIESFCTHRSFEPRFKIPSIIVLSQIHCQANCIHIRRIFNAPAVLSAINLLLNAPVKATMSNMRNREVRYG